MARDDRLHLPSRLPPPPPSAGRGSPSAGPSRAAARRPTDPGRVRGEPAQSHRRRRAMAVQPAGTEVRLVGAGVAPDERRIAPQVAPNASDIARAGLPSAMGTL